MEKRLFLAVFLSLGVVFLFQTLFKVSQPPAAKVEVVENKAVVVNEGIVAEGSVPVVLEKKTVNEPAFQERTAILENKQYKISLTNRGGNIGSIYLKDLQHEMPTRNLGGLDLFDNEEFNIAVKNNKAVLTHTSATWLVTKELTINNNNTITALVSVKNAGKTAENFGGDKTSFIIDTVRLDKTNVQSDRTLYEYSIKSDSRFIRKDNARNFTDKWNKEEVVPVDWMAFRDKYFVTIVEAGQKETNYFVKKVSDKELRLGSTLAMTAVAPGQTITLHYKMYVGPQKLDLLAAAEPSFAKVMVFSNWGWLDAISKGIYWLLGAIHKLIPVWGICIIVISLIVYGGMYPLTLKSLVSMKKLQVLQPKMKELQEKYKSNPERLNKEVVELYRVHQVNPVSGCLPMLLQMPIFVGLYQVLWRSVYFRGESFLWMKDLSMPDRTIKLPFTMPFLGEYVNVLPILMVGIMFVQQQLNMKSMAAATPEQAQQQKMMAIFFPIVIGFIFYNMASGLNLYFVVFYVLSTLSQWHISTSTNTAA